MNEVTQTLGFEVRHEPIDLAGQTRPFLITAAGRRRIATAEEAKLWAALLAAQGRVVELEAQADAQHGRKKPR